jgi:hypothetical protein
MTYKGNIDLKNTKGFYDFEKCHFKNNIIFFESVFTDKVGTYIDIINGQFINEANSENQEHFNDKIKIVNGIKDFVTDMLSFEIEEYQISEQMPDNLFNLMCIRDYVKNQSLFDTFFHDNLYVKNNIKKIERK